MLRSNGERFCTCFMRETAILDAFYTIEPSPWSLDFGFHAFPDGFLALFVKNGLKAFEQSCKRLGKKWSFCLGRMLDFGSNRARRPCDAPASPTPPQSPSDRHSESLSVYLRICASAYLRNCVSVYLSIGVSVYLCICVSEYMCICVSVLLCIHVSVYQCICVRVGGVICIVYWETWLKN